MLNLTQKITSRRYSLLAGLVHLVTTVTLMQLLQGKESILAARSSISAIFVKSSNKIY